MSANFSFKSIVPHIIAIVIFLSITIVYFNPLLKGKDIKQGDITNFSGMSKEIVDFRDTYHEEPLWTNSMFGGMPAYQISVLYPSNLIAHVNRVLMLWWLPSPANFLFLYLLGFYILLLALKMDPWLGVLGAIAFAFSSYFFIIIEAGHNSKAHAIGYMAPVLAGVILTFRGRYLTGGILTALFLALELYANHLQITYYLFFIIIIYGITELIDKIKNKQLLLFLKPVGVLGLAVVLAIGCNITSLWATYDYGKDTTRGKSDLTFNKENKTSGLDKDYATGWSYGKGETMTLMIPNFKGGASGRIGENKEALKNIDPQMKQHVAQVDQYWADQPFTSGPVYAGAIVFFLSVLGLFLVEGRLKWVLFIATIVSILLAWGKNFMGLTDIFLDYFPGYSKFRTVSMILVIAELTIPLLAILALDKIIRNGNLLKEKVKLPFLSNPLTKQKLFYVAFGLTGGLALIYYLIPDALSVFFKAGEYDDTYAQIAKNNSEDVAKTFLDNVEIARKNIFTSDAIRSFLFITLAAGLLWLYLKSKMDKKLLLGALGFLVLADMWTVNKRYLNNDNFVNKVETKTPYKPSQANLMILEDKDPDYRVLNLAVSTFNDASTSYFHKSIGGYHGAKLKRYQELIEYQISNNIQNIQNAFKQNPTDSSIMTTLSGQQALNMLNARYIIYNPEAAPLLNPFALGNVWFVQEYNIVANADSEITALSNFDPSNTAIVDAVFQDKLKGFTYKEDSTASIKLTNYKANDLKYESQSSNEQLAVFSEIYYKSGWNAYIDDKPASYFRVNYVLRAMRIPAGKHKIEFKFEPSIYNIGESVSLASSALLILLSLGILFVKVKRKLVGQTVNKNN